MFLGRWKALGETVEGCEFLTPDRYLSRTQAIQLFHAFLLQVRESGGLVYLVQNESDGFFATHFADALMTSLHIPASNLVSIDQDASLPLSILLKKSDLLITICVNAPSPETNAATAMAKSHDIPIIALTGNPLDHPLYGQGDLNLHFSGNDKTLIATAQYTLLNAVIDEWTHNSSPLFMQQKLPSIGTRPQNLATGLRL